MDYEFRFDQVKEKYGSLRLYHNGNKDIDKITNEAEILSCHTCQECGKIGKQIGDYWIYTMCKECAEKNNVAYER